MDGLRAVLSLGSGSMLKDSRFSRVLSPTSATPTQFTFTFYQQAKGVRGWLMNPMVRLMQGRGRRQGVTALKDHIEHSHGRH